MMDRENQMHQIGREGSNEDEVGHKW